MKIEKRTILVKDLIKDYSYDDETNKVVGYGGKLDIRPAYQRDFIYPPNRQCEVIYTMLKGDHGFPLNIMYWIQNKDSYELLDGQQRTVSICEFCIGHFQIKLYGNKEYKFYNLPEPQKNQILNYELEVYVCSGDNDEEVDNKEKIEWFNVINIKGLELTQQELYNATFPGNWLNDAKRYFSRCHLNHAPNCLAFKKGGSYIDGEYDRQGVLELVLKWKSNNNVWKYMEDHHNDPDASDLINYFETLIEWISIMFPDTHSSMKGLDWGRLYDTYKSVEPSEHIRNRVQELIEDRYVDCNAGVYEYVLSGEDPAFLKLLNIRIFGKDTKEKAYTKQTRIAKAEGISNCPECAKYSEHNKTKIYKINEMDADHVSAWSGGGKTNLDNCQVLCKYHNTLKGNR